MSSELNELDVPPEVHSDGNPFEMIRFFICDKKDHVTLRVGLFEVEKEPRVWGAILADIARHAIIGMQQDSADRPSADALLQEIEAGYKERIAEEANLQGQLGDWRQ